MQNAIAITKGCVNKLSSTDLKDSACAEVSSSTYENFDNFMICTKRRMSSILLTSVSWRKEGETKVAGL